MTATNFSKRRGEDVLQLVSFQLGTEEFAVDILKIREINKMSEVTKVPKSPDFVEGVINLRGLVIPVIDLRRKFGLEMTERGKNTRIIVIEIRNRIVGFIVDSVSEVLRVPLDRIEPPPPMVAKIDSEFIKGVGKLNDRLLILLDVNRILNTGEVELLEGPSASELGESGSGDNDGKVMEYRGLAGLVEVDKSISEVVDKVDQNIAISPGELDSLVVHVKGLLEGNFTLGDLDLYGEMGELAKFINDTKKSLQCFDAAEIAEKDIPAASDQLEGIVEATEDATNNILTASEVMLDDQEKIKTVTEMIKTIDFSENQEFIEKRDNATSVLDELYSANSAHLMDVMSACNFQDLTGQRIQKIIALVKGIESKVMKMILTFNIKRQEKMGAKEEKDENILSKEKEMLAAYEDMDLKGPQRKAEAVSQDEVDDLLNDLFG